MFRVAATRFQKHVCRESHVRPAQSSNPHTHVCPFAGETCFFVPSASIISSLIVHPLSSVTRRYDPSRGICATRFILWCRFVPSSQPVFDISARSQSFRSPAESVGTTAGPHSARVCVHYRSAIL